MTVCGKEPAVKTPHSATFSSLVPCCIDTTIRKGDSNEWKHVIEKFDAQLLTKTYDECVLTI